MKFIIDRFEGDFAVVELENKTLANMPKILLPSSVQEGDVIEIIVNKKHTEERKENIKKLMDEVWRILDV